MLKCYLVDDETHAIDTLASYIEKAPGLELLGSSIDPLEALHLIGTSLHPDITFLDVDMPQLSGIDLAGLINDRTAVIFTTAFPNYAVDAFEKNAYDYLLKPISFERFLNSVNKVSHLLKTVFTVNRDDHIYLKSNIKGKVIRVNFSEILYTESIKNYMVIHMREEKIRTYLTMKELENILPDGLFLRVHKSFLVNIKEIRSVSASSIHLKNNSIEIPLGQIYRSALQDHITDKLVISSRRT